MSSPAAVLLSFACFACCTGSGTNPAPATSAPDAVRLLVDDKEIEFRDAHVLSVDDDDQRFHVTMTAPTRFEDQQHRAVVLRHGDVRIPVTSWGSNGDESWFLFDVAAPQGRSLAKGLGVEARPRPAWHCKLTGAVAFAAEPVVDDLQLPMRFTVTNEGPEAVWLQDGGRGRNPVGRDDRFRFEVLCNGEPVATSSVPNFGGMAVYRRLAPGESWTLQPDLRQWCNLAKPGHYVVRASYEADLMPAAYEPGKPVPLGSYAHWQRSRVVSAEVATDVRHRN